MRFPRFLRTYHYVFLFQQFFSSQLIGPWFKYFLLIQFFIDCVTFLLRQEKNISQPWGIFFFLLTFHRSKFQTTAQHLVNIVFFVIGVDIVTNRSFIGTLKTRRESLKDDTMRSVVVELVFLLHCTVQMTVTLWILLSNTLTKI